MKSLKNNLLCTAAVCALLALTGTVRAQDAGILSAASWTTEKVAEGVILHTAAFEGNLFDSNQYLCVLEVAPGVRFDIVSSEEGKLEKTTAMAAKTGAVAAVNGSFFNMRKPFGSVTYFRVDGEEIAPNALSSNGPGSGRGHHQKGAVATFNGTLYSLKGDDLERWERDIEAEDVLTTGPVIIAGGRPENLETSSFNTTRHPRTAAGRRADGTVVLVVADGRHAEAAGLSMSELQQIMQALGCRDAINLDGGGSTTMVVSGRIVNHPCDNRKFDPAGERSVANAI
ncbi:MAG: phosphodiester glycosidase family protein, partial [Bacteroidales bacterium]|nr:phosphodiester glycosidase family protein [Bacteroidales bacterium]